MQNDGYAQVAMAYTDSSGGFRFRGLTGGVYYVEVDPAGAEYERQTQRVEAMPFRARGDAAGETFRQTAQRDKLTKLAEQLRQKAAAGNDK